MYNFWMSKFTLQNHEKESLLFSYRCIAIFFLMFLFFIAILSRLIYLQVKEQSQFTTLSIHNLLRVVPTEPTRGLIYDRNGVLLAKNIPVFSLAIIPSDVGNLNDTVAALSKIVSLQKTDISDFYHALTKYHRYEPVPLKYKLNEKELDVIYLNQYRFPGVIIQANMLREYPLGDIVSNIVGYVGRINAVELKKLSTTNNYLPSDYIGKTGIEQFYEPLLHGYVGSALSEVNASGEVVRHLKAIQQTPGKTIYLTIDSKLQAFAKQALGDNNGALVAIQPSTGQILALVTNPTYDPNLFVMGISNDDYQKLQADPDHPLYDRAIRGLYSPGSTIKPFQALAGLQNGIITPQYTINDPGWYRVPNTKHIFHEDLNRVYGLVNLHKAIQVSSDVYFYNLAVKQGIKRIDNFLHQFGFGQKTKVEMPHELPGVLPTPEWKELNKGLPWYTGDTVNIGIGQGMLLVTPIQLAQAVSIIAERGKRFQPHLLLKSQNANNTFIVQPPIQLPSIILQNNSYWDDVISGMQAVINGGTAVHFGPHPDFDVAGKTGTAQVFGIYRDEETTDWQRPKKLRNNHLFIEFAPINNPDIAIAIITEHVNLADTIGGEVTRFYMNEIKNNQKIPPGKPNDKPTS